jgi:acetyl esterase/lipase
MKLPLLAGLILSLSLLAVAVEAAPRVELDVTFLTPDRKEKLDLYLPAPPPAGKLSPAVVWVHGGGWTGGTKSEARAKEICTTLVNAGYVAVSIDYRLGDGAWPTCLLDCKNAVRFLRAHAAEYHLDPERIAVAGGSAGGHLALMVGFTIGKKEWEPTAPYPGVSSAVRCVIDMYGPANLLTHQQTTPTGEPTATRKLMGNSLKVFEAASDDADVLRAASPVTQAAKGCPPVLVLHGRADPTVDYPQSEELVRVMKERGVEHEAVFLDGVGHTFDWETWNKKPLPRDLRPVALAFLAKHLTGSGGR